MNAYILTSACLLFLLGLAHSIFGEILIFKNLRATGSIIPSMFNEHLKERHTRIIWATWHLVTVLGWCMGVVLIRIAYLASSQLLTFIVNSISLATLVGSLLVLIGTKGKHPGWVVLLIISILLWVGEIKI
ncbi:hypothetical protein [Fulvivirga imtechensis]|uniref:hypothetical protein n=1 Tax=Fulvivirga imtechensis TaxID=881893 RepID=UPI00059041AF|nr:hypothetical protein [Fulvivirga imtechensis]